MSIIADYTNLKEKEDALNNVIKAKDINLADNINDISKILRCESLRLNGDTFEFYSPNGPVKCIFKNNNQWYLKDICYIDYNAGSVELTFYNRSTGRSIVLGTSEHLYLDESYMRLVCGGSNVYCFRFLSGILCLEYGRVNFKLNDTLDIDDLPDTGYINELYINLYKNKMFYEVAINIGYLSLMKTLDSNEKAQFISKMIGVDGLCRFLDNKNLLLSLPCSGGKMLNINIFLPYCLVRQKYNHYIELSEFYVCFENCDIQLSFRMRRYLRAHISSCIIRYKGIPYEFTMSSDGFCMKVDDRFPISNDQIFGGNYQLSIGIEDLCGIFCPIMLPDSLDPNQEYKRMASDLGASHFLSIKSTVDNRTLNVTIVLKVKGGLLNILCPGIRFCKPGGYEKQYWMGGEDISIKFASYAQNVQNLSMLFVVGGVSTVVTMHSGVLRFNDLKMDAICDIWSSDILVNVKDFKFFIDQYISKRKELLSREVLVTTDNLRVLHKMVARKVNNQSVCIIYSIFLFLFMLVI